MGGEGFGVICDAGVFEILRQRGFMGVVGRDGIFLEIIWAAGGVLGIFVRCLCKWVCGKITCSGGGCHPRMESPASNINPRIICGFGTRWIYPIGELTLRLFFGLGWTPACWKPKKLSLCLVLWNICSKVFYQFSVD